MSVPDPARTLPWVAAGTDALLARLATVDVAAASGLPGWTHGHVAAHVARNADALGRLLTWARTGVETPMYASPAHRAEEIARDAGRARDVQLADVRWTADALAAAMAGLPPSGWAATVRSARGRLITATELPWMRVKEVWLHAVDLGLATSAIPADVGAALFDDVTAGFVTRDDVPGLRLAPTGGDPVVIGDGATAVAGTPTALVLWLVGRSDGDGLDTGSTLPALPSWL